MYKEEKTGVAAGKAVALAPARTQREGAGDWCPFQEKAKNRKRRRKEKKPERARIENTFMRICVSEYE